MLATVPATTTYPVDIATHNFGMALAFADGMRTFTFLPCLLAPLLLSLNACQTAEEDPSCIGDNCDEIDVKSAICRDSLFDNSGKQRGSQELLAELSDPFARLVLGADSELFDAQGNLCPPGNLEDLFDVIKTSAGEDADCKVVTMPVSEEAQLLATADAHFRSVHQIKCKGMESFELLMSFNEIIAFQRDEADDASKGVFNYYKSNNDGWVFHGNSMDLLEGEGRNGERQCAACHTGGGIIMKELDTPWVHWEGHMNAPGADDQVPEFARKGTGSTMEGIVDKSLRPFTKAKVERLTDSGSMKELLKPLFCTIDLNIDSSNAFNGDDFSGVPGDLLLDPLLEGRDPSSFNASTDSGKRIKIANDVYEAALVAVDQRLPVPADATPNGEPIRDTVFQFSYPERSDQDDVYVRELIEAGVIDLEMASDVLAVDFTRPIFSDARCEVLDLVQEAIDSGDVDDSDRSAAGVRKTLVASLTGYADGSAPATLLSYLLEDEQLDSTHKAGAQSFIESCESRALMTQAVFMEEILELTGMYRSRMVEERQPLVESPLTLPAMARRPRGPDLHLDPTCEMSVESIPSPGVRESVPTPEIPVPDETN